MNPNLKDDELEALMAELDAQSATMMASVTTKAQPVVAASTSSTAGAPDPVVVPDTAPAATESPEIKAATTAPQPQAEKEPVVTSDSQTQAVEPTTAPAVEPTTKPAVKPAEVLVPDRHAVEKAPEDPAPVVEAKVESATPVVNDTNVVQQAPQQEELLPPPKAARPSLKFAPNTEKYKEDVAVRETDLDNCMIQQSSHRVFYGALAAQAEGQADALKSRFDVMEARLFHKHRSELAKGTEKVTEKLVENAVKMDPLWIAGKEAVIEAQTIASINRAVVMGFVDRRDMLIQLCSDRRSEAQGALRLLQKEAGEESLASRAANAAKAVFQKS